MTGDGYCQNREIIHIERTERIEKNRNNSFRCCSSCRALVISGMDLVLRASSYAHSMPLIAITALLQASKSKNNGLESLENRFFLNI